jgi:hypothetical protein
MTTITTTATTNTRRSLGAVLLSRRGAVYLPTITAQPDVDAIAGVALLETDLVERGYLLSAGLRQALTALDTDALATAGQSLLKDIDGALGADRTHTPLFRGFPRTTPRDTFALYVDRVLALLLQVPEQPCVLCGTNGTVHAVSPCAHLVCRSCFDGADYSACPICNRSIDAGDPFLRPAPPRTVASTRRALPQRLRVLSLGGDLTARTADAGGELSTLLARAGALSPQDTEDLMVLLDEAGDRSDLAWLPEVIPGRETKARVLAWLLADKDAYTATLAAVTARITTATDVLRLLVVLSGGDAGLVEIPRFTAVSRPLRRALLMALNGLDPVLVTEDMKRHPAAWKHAAERLHPFEYAHRYPKVALAVAALREFLLTEDSLSQTLRAPARRSTATTLDAGMVSLPVWASQVETALADGHVERAVPLIAQRPGEFVRRLDHMLRLADPAAAEAVLTALDKAVRQVSPAVLLSALGAIRTRSRKADSRVFFPKGSDATAHIVADERAPLTTSVTDRTVGILTGEVLRRAAELAPVDVAVVDAALDGVIAPFAERTASRSLVTLPRGSELPIPQGHTVRLFVHWMESATSGVTDLDLSAAMFNDGWEHIGTCDYTSYRYFDGAVHSGDRTSAPAPEGASEFVDLNLDELAARGVRYVVGTVFSYNNVPFEELADAFAGVMVRDEPGEAGPVFDARQVEQRFDLTSKARASVPLLIDVNDRTMRWLDVVQAVTGSNHAVHRHAGAIALLGQALTGLFASGARIGLGELAVWQAAARAKTVIVRHTDGSASTYQRGADEDALAFAARIGSPARDAAVEGDPPAAQLAYLMRGDTLLARDAEVYALHPAGIDTGVVRLMSAPDVVTALAAK